MISCVTRLSMRTEHIRAMKLYYNGIKAGTIGKFSGRGCGYQLIKGVSKKKPPR